MTNQFNFEEAIKALQSGKKLNDKDSVLTRLKSLRKKDLLDFTLI